MASVSGKGERNAVGVTGQVLTLRSVEKVAKLPLSKRLQQSRLALEGQASCWYHALLLLSFATSTANFRSIADDRRTQQTGISLCSIVLANDLLLFPMRRRLFDQRNLGLLQTTWRCKAAGKRRACCKNAYMKLPPGHVPGISFIKSSSRGGFGEKLLKQLGWKEGQGLGAEGQGISSFIKVHKKEDASGVRQLRCLAA